VLHRDSQLGRRDESQNQAGREPDGQLAGHNAPPVVRSKPQLRGAALQSLRLSRQHGGAGQKSAAVGPRPAFAAWGQTQEHQLGVWACGVHGRRHQTHAELKQGASEEVVLGQSHQLAGSHPLCPAPWPLFHQCHFQLHLELVKRLKTCLP